ncbi:hypothetical protein BDV96DRAFT_608074 [Lophiotrema nucula]|uniref:Uncharacterized protein n=1 Tax=Lophiotrema nucula TaxID=690887 RepID=A0A6A5YFI5_9PLEO|nr:hypothetical protein BDV96DRAFT_608074 [Lophiotrema nucula]
MKPSAEGLETSSSQDNDHHTNEMRKNLRRRTKLRSQHRYISTEDSSSSSSPSTSKRSTEEQAEQVKIIRKQSDSKAQSVYSDGRERPTKYASTNARGRREISGLGTVIYPYPNNIRSSHGHVENKQPLLKLPGEDNTPLPLRVEKWKNNVYLGSPEEGSRQGGNAKRNSAGIHHFSTKQDPDI